jgi:hypothetical protein
MQEVSELPPGDDLFQSYDIFFGNNDYDTTGLQPAEALSEIRFELETAMSAVLLLRHDMSKAEALEAIDNLRWLVAHSADK